jgi:hypothetical protein
VVRKRAARTGGGAAERRLRSLAPAAVTLRDAARHVVAGLLQDVPCPPTDLAALGQKLDVQEIAYESFPGSGEVHKVKDGYRIVCSSDQPRSRQRFTVAHELAHVILERTGRNAPREGSDVERICDALATECLMPTSVFESRVPDNLTLRDVSALADTFGTSLMATAIRCAEFRSVCVFGVSGDRVTWAFGGVRSGALTHLLDEVRDNVRAVMAGEQPQPHVYFYGAGSRGGYRRFDWLRLKNGSAVFLLAQDSRLAEGAAAGGPLS